MYKLGWALALALLLPGCGSSGGSSDPSPSAPAVSKDLEAFRPLVGKTLSEASAWLDAHPTPSPSEPETHVTQIRPVRIDGEDQVVSMDLRPSRVNVVLEGGKIVSVESVG